MPQAEGAVLGFEVLFWGFKSPLILTGLGIRAVAEARRSTGRGKNVYSTGRGKCFPQPFSELRWSNDAVQPDDRGREWSSDASMSV